MAWAGGVFTKDDLFPRHIPNLTEPDLTPTEVRLPRGCGKGCAGCAVAHPENPVGVQNTYFAHPASM